MSVSSGCCVWLAICVSVSHLCVLRLLSLSQWSPLCVPLDIFVCIVGHLCVLVVIFVCVLLVIFVCLGHLCISLVIFLSCWSSFCVLLVIFVCLVDHLCVSCWSPLCHCLSLCASLVIFVYADISVHLVSRFCVSSQSLFYA